ncbi:MAG: phosphoribosylaminoimidazolesuccinocarboxamide synthase [Calditrichae bacterium]|nr:phosphoribosylaminoimidazolesuccinocarboxamide synthase [Calditrichia bacterium]NIW78214.1 phosphoribosylaminoimidazolesuccinocarboxamide synthase [Calditrichia bacterium]
MELKELLSEGATKKIYATHQNDQVVVEFYEKSSGSGSKKKDITEEKNKINNDVSTLLFEYLESYNVPTHFSQKLDEKSFLAKRLDMIPIIITVYNVASKELSERLGIEDGKLLEFPVVELYYKDEKRKLPMINEYHAYALGLCDRKEMTSLMRIATKVNAVLKSFFARKKLQLISFNLEFGRYQNQVLLADDVSVDSLSLWEISDDGEFQKLDDKKIDTYRKINSLIFGTG